MNVVGTLKNVVGKLKKNKNKKVTVVFADYDLFRFKKI